MTDKQKGFLLVLFCTVCWAITGNLGTYLFVEKGMTPAQVTSVRQLFSGVFLVLIHAIQQPKKVSYLFRTKADVIRVVIFGLFGILFMQLFFYMAIEQSNAPTASIIQYTAPFLVMVYYSIVNRSFPKPVMIAALVMALLGVFLLVTHGDVDTLSISPLALLYGMMAAVGYSLYNILSIPLVTRYDSKQVSGLAMLVAGTTLTLALRPFTTPFVFDLGTVLALGFVAIFGTFLPFVLYLEGAKRITPQKASILATVEPLFSTVIAVLFLGQVFYAMDYLGVVLVVAAVILLSLPEQKRVKSE